MRKGQGLPMVSASMTMWALIIIVALMMGSVIFYLIFVEARNSINSAIGITGESGKIVYDIDYVKAAMQPYSYAAMFSFISNGALNEQALMSMFAFNNKYFNPSPVKELITGFAPRYFAMNIIDYNDPTKTLSLAKRTWLRCGNYAEGTCSTSACPAGMKEVPDTHSECKDSTTTMPKCCVDDPTITIERCGSATMPNYGVCVDKSNVNSAGTICRTGRAPTNYHCSAGKVCCIPTTAEDWLATISGVEVYSTELPFFYQGKLGYLQIKVSSDV